MTSVARVYYKSGNSIIKRIKHAWRKLEIMMMKKQYVFVGNIYMFFFKMNFVFQCKQKSSYKADF